MSIAQSFNDIGVSRDISRINIGIVDTEYSGEIYKLVERIEKNLDISERIKDACLSPSVSYISLEESGKKDKFAFKEWIELLSSSDESTDITSLIKSIDELLIQLKPEMTSFFSSLSELFASVGLKYLNYIDIFNTLVIVKEIYDDKGIPSTDLMKKVDSDSLIRTIMLFINQEFYILKNGIKNIIQNMLSAGSNVYDYEYLAKTICVVYRATGIIEVFMKAFNMSLLHSEDTNPKLNSHKKIDKIAFLYGVAKLHVNYMIYYIYAVASSYDIQLGHPDLTRLIVQINRTVDNISHRYTRNMMGVLALESTMKPYFQDLYLPEKKPCKASTKKTSKSNGSNNSGSNICFIL